MAVMLKPSLDGESAAVAVGSAPQPTRCVLCQAEVPASGTRRVNGQQVCATCASQVETELAASRGSALGLVPGAVGGAIGALLGAAAWAVIAVVTDYEIGYIAVLVGFLAGHGVRLGARGARGKGLQILAAAMSIVGLVLAKYFIIAHFTIAALAEEGIQAGYLDPRMIAIFPIALVDVASPFDLLWIALAVGTAFRAPAPHQVKVEG